MNSDCQKVKNSLIDIIEKNIPESQKKAIQDHLECCPQCNRLVDRFARIWNELSVTGKSIPLEKFWPALLAKIQAYEKPRGLQEKMLAAMRNSLRPAAVSLILLFGIFIGYQLGNIPRMDTAQSEMLSVYAEQYVQDFQDFPEGSVGDFYTKYKIQNQQEVP
jgi:predicted anti-sigma-YlaC factor YlaD